MPNAIDRQVLMGMGTPTREQLDGNRSGDAQSTMAGGLMFQPSRLSTPARADMIDRAGLVALLVALLCISIWWYSLLFRFLLRSAAALLGVT